jgi:hypothetical protein
VNLSGVTKLDVTAFAPPLIIGGTNVRLVGSIASALEPD